MPLGPPKQRAVLALLASRAGEVVGVDNIVDALWDDDLPQTATNAVHTYVAGLRRALEPGRSRREAGAILTSVSGGYCLRMEPEQVDATLFTRRHARARRSRIGGSPDEAVLCYEEALALWRGDAYSGVPGPFAAVERTRLRDLRLTAIEEWAADMLEAGRHAEVVTELSAAVGEEPLREKLRWLLMLTLYRSGRQAHALAVYTETRQLLNQELGIEPGPELRSLHQQILAGHPALRRKGDAAAVRPPRRHAGGAPDLSRPVQLPPLARGFAGRTADLTRLEELLDHERGGYGASTPIAVVDGPAGVGKTAFVLELAHRLLDRFPDGQLYVDLCGTGRQGRPLTASDALEQLLASLGVERSRMPADVAGRTTLYRSLLHGRRMLVVLDEALGADQLRPLIPRGSSCVLATSRQRFSGLAARDGAHVLTMGPLADHDAATLLTSLCGGRLRGQEAAAVRLVRLCGGLPLALRIAAEELSANPAVPLSVIIERFAAACAEHESPPNREAAPVRPVEWESGPGSGRETPTSVQDDRAEARAVVLR
ncbi:BTAD domain-containing putative transcriptional regulator [Streptomyces sp. B1I3]|uniref:AfsR/SARP family transcriptional regulator n=1 Tax=Streptomyces sp. B1I3 TaxID=3042264 RepID=UPI0027D913BF|nr:BTAD domain-containing putative transcriptional regulator [Streptomyces sp. B1I3]